MLHLLRFTITAAVLSFLLPSLRAADTPFALPKAAPLATMIFSDGLALKDISIAVSKALVADGWENLGWEGNVTTATAKQSRISIKVFVLASAAEVKLYAEYTSDNNATEEKCRTVSLRALRSLEKAIAEALKLSFRKAKGEETVDRATS